MKTFYKITLTIALFNIFLVLISFPSSPVATFGEYIFGDYTMYLGSVISVFALSVFTTAIVYLWKNL